MFNFDYIKKEVIKEHNPNWPEIPDHPYRILIVRGNSKHYFLIKIPNKRGLQQIAFNHSSDIDFQDLINLYKKCTAKPYSFFVIDDTLASDNFSRFRKNLVERI